MIDINEKYEVLLGRIRTWAEHKQDIRAVLIQGSRARSEMPADQWSDLDLNIISATPCVYLDSAEWLSSMGEPWLTFLEIAADGDGIEQRVLFEDGLDVDFTISSEASIRQMLTGGIPEQARYTLKKGVRMLVDKDGFSNLLAELDIGEIEAKPPSEYEYLELVNDFIYHYIWALKKLRRCELWAAIGCSDGYMKGQLLKLTEWHAHAIHGWNYDTWHSGRFLDHWADRRVVDGLKTSFAHYESDDILRSLTETHRLFKLLAIEVAERLGFSYPYADEGKVLAWAHENLLK
ncbi:aminoglycoside 6-adenylyltransferase [Sporobacter termitidis DSM 10068]|uniref:Aminoglycoside 6-adenylyltransferase n=1 Tax=Sporobacter termitidis DSM 10068 TaxID=1123282 RepID=A0A1M5UEZ9_9FIRM|nr:aminoglycoside 6-adenylyltransferase [Sporobacter termitidis]SHH61416.1 aminoglycoside 6-adenylyltransferase [Sporobacter termitidis DSM 10068]